MNDPISIVGMVPVIIFKDDAEGIWYAHCPALEITGYGNTEAESTDSFEVMLREVVGYLVEHGTLKEELERLGWEIKTELVPPSVEVLLERDKDLRRMMSLRHTLEYRQLPTAA